MNFTTVLPLRWKGQEAFPPLFAPPTQNVSRQSYRVLIKSHYWASPHQSRTFETLKAVTLTETWSHLLCLEEVSCAVTCLLVLSAAFSSVLWSPHWASGPRATSSALFCSAGCVWPRCEIWSVSSIRAWNRAAWTEWPNPCSCATQELTSGDWSERGERLIDSLYACWERGHAALFTSFLLKLTLIVHWTDLMSRWIIQKANAANYYASIHCYFTHF